MQSSMEVRWFLPGAIPEELNQWFEQDQTEAISQEEREDRYLCLPKRQELGIKLREGNLEIKRQLDDRGVQKIAKGIKGRIEKWLKWSFTLDSQDEEQTNLSASQKAWIVVKKIRRSKTYRVTSHGEIEVVKAGKELDQGCHIELTELSALEQEWYSLGFEAFGQEDALEKMLQRALEVALTTSDLPSLKAKQSYGYPKWLSRLQKDY